ncbi:hypothetical protein G6514_000258 [Epicoccum nigrum]|nr:hypothetical protein G6514_000258 [Epicoccum nigrum]
MADKSIDSRIVDILNRLKAVETTMYEPKDSKEQDSKEQDGKEQEKNTETVKKDNKYRLRADLEDLKIRIAALADDSDDDAVDTSPVGEKATTVFIPQLNRVTWTRFMNSVVGDEQYAIDVLIGPVKSHWHIRQEEMHHPQSGAEETKLDHHALSSSVGDSAGSADMGARAPAKERNETQSEVPERIRLNCPKILATFYNVLGETLPDRPKNVLIRPYKALIRHDEALRQRLRELQVRHEKDLQDTSQQQPSTEENQSSVANNSDGPDSSATPTQNNELVPFTDIDDHKIELQGLKCLLEFMDTYLVPVQQRYRSATAKKICFSDLWYLYRPGDLVVITDETNNETNKETNNETKKKGPRHMKTNKVPLSLCRVLSVSRGRPDLTTLHGAESAVKPPVIKMNDFRIQGHTIAYDGTNFGPSPQVFSISPFQGEKEISTLDPCPLRYAERFSDLETRLIEKGREFLQYTKPSHCRYAGPSYSTLRNVSHDPDAEKNTMIDGHVIVDFKEARRNNYAWVLRQEILDADEGLSSEIDEDEPRTIWKDKERKSWFERWTRMIFDDDYVDRNDEEEYIESNIFLTAWKSNKTVDQEYLERTDYALLPNRVVGYDLYRHKFAILAIEYLQPVRANTDGWADLKLPSGHKRMVQAQIRTHFLRKMSRQNRDSEDTDIDLVRGKGLGLIILLHGAPGVGKTSTAECVAESLGKPLYPITCGDLGVTAESVEQTLASTFAKAEAWDCVLLLDEADVFLAQRTRTDLARNAIVSVFLRVLEYYKGTLILTTNRVGAFDEAFKSRIHLNLYYPALNREQTSAIWEMNLERIIKRKQGRLAADVPKILAFGKQLFERQSQTTSARWNGRQIRNAFQTALAMAEYEALGDSGLTADWKLLEKIHSRLEVKHFETVASASAHFDAYIQETIGGNDADRARHDRDRADHFKWYVPVNAQNESRPTQWAFNTPGPQGSGPFASPSGFKPSGIAFNTQREPQPGQWAFNTPGPPEGSYQSANPDPFTSSSAYQQSVFYASQEAAAAKTTFQQGASWASPQQPWAGIGSSPARPPQESDGPNPYMLNATAPAGWPHAKDESEYGHQNPSFNQFDGGRQGAPSTPSNRDQRPDLRTPVGMGAAQSQDDDGY